MMKSKQNNFKRDIKEYRLPYVFNSAHMKKNKHRLYSTARMECTKMSKQFPEKKPTKFYTSIKSVTILWEQIRKAGNTSGSIATASQEMT